MTSADDKIPAPLAKDLRALAHDLSNSLETIVQATYLIRQAGPPEDWRHWLESIEQASRDAAALNNTLRTILREHAGTSAA